MGTSLQSEIKFPTEDIAWARLAAFVDGEGHIEIRSKNKGQIAHSLMLSVGNTDLRLSVWLQETFGGSVRLKKTNGARKHFWEWRVGGRNAARLLEYCLPFFVMKADQAEIAIAFSRLVMGKGGSGKGLGTGRARPITVTPEMNEARTALMFKLREARNNFTERLA